MSGPLTLPLLTERLELRDFVAADEEAVHAYSSDPEVVRFMFWGPRTPDDTRTYLAAMLASQRATPRSTWELAVVRRADGRVIGACDLTLEGDGLSEGDLGYVLAREAWGQGYASELARALVHAGFERMGLRRIFAMCDPANTGSARVLEKAGLQQRRLIERHIEAKGRWWASLLYDLRADEWRARP